MGSDLKLTGLASGFDWQPLVEKLIELEAVPKKRLQAEKVRNNEKVSELGILKSQLDTLNGAATALQNKDLFNARSVGISSSSSSGFTATAAANSLTGDFDLFVHSLASKTEISSKNRHPGRLASGVNPNTALKDLPIFSNITTGTFTISGKTFSIDNRNMTLQDVMDNVNATLGSVKGVNPENDDSGITLEYDAISDKMYFDTNEGSPVASSKLPVLGSSTDSSNFLQAMRLLDQATSERNADYETGSLISIFNAGDGGKAWIHSSDSTLGLNASDDRLYASFNGMLYERTKVENDYNPASSYQAGEKVYHKGFVYESTNALPSSSWSGTETNQGDSVSHNGLFYELLVNLETAKIDSFSSVDSGAHVVSQPVNGGTTTSADAYKAGDIVKADDGSFFRSIKDRTDSSTIDWSNYGALSGFNNPIASQGWAGNLPATSYNSGRMYQMTQGASATEHGGAADSTVYNSAGGWGGATELVAGKAGVAGAENHYYLPKTSNWDNVQAHSAASNYASGDIIIQGGQFLQANSNLAPSAFNPANWTNVTSAVNDLNSVGTGALADTFWTKADLSVTNSTYWSEIGHANGANDFDSNYWQQIKPEMNRSDGLGNLLNSTDYSIWAQVGGVGGNAGDALWGNRDAGETPIPNDGNFTYSTWSGSADPGDYVLSGTKIFQATVATLNDPGGTGNESDWNLVADASTMTAATVSEQANKRRFTDTSFWSHYTIPDPDQNSGHWQAVKEKVITSSQPLGTVDMTVSLASSNFGGSFAGLASGLGNFFVGEGEGAVRIDYDVNNDSLSELIDRVNSSSANINLFYDPIGDRFVARNKDTGAIGITLHESSTWDRLASSSVNVGAGNILQLMGLADPAVISNSFNPSNLSSYSEGTYVSISSGTATTYWQALQDSPSEDPSASSAQWRQVIQGVGRTMTSELGSNSSVTINGGDLVYSTGSKFEGKHHGYEGISFDVASVSIGGSASFTVAKDVKAAKSAIDKFVEEFNDAQDYINSLTAVTQDGENVSSGSFTGNIEISRLGSQLRKVVFGETRPHSASGRTSDGADLIINSNDGSNTEIDNIATQLSLDSGNDGYIIKVLNQNASGSSAYFKWNGSSLDWEQTTAAFSTFRLPDVGLDFGVGSDRLVVENSALLLQALSENPEKVEALFSEATVENAFDENTQSSRPYQGISYALDDFISNFLSGDDGTGYKGAYQTHIDSVKSQNERIDDKIEQLERYLKSREDQLSAGFMKMEEMQSKLDTQLQTLQNSLPKKK
ncbi:MAG: flagellar filament capping protein FliD [Opitutae bacterium]|nr:flagellar filament capping protein FliD [Opitutae bacterium]